MLQMINNFLEKRDEKKIERITRNLLSLGYQKITIHEGNKLVGYSLVKGNKSIFVEVF